MKSAGMKALAFSGITAALSVTLLFIASLTATSYMALTALAGCAFSLLALKYGIRYGVLSYFAASVISFILIPDKYIFFLFTAFFGLYPIIKTLIEASIRSFAITIPIKLIFFNAVFAASAYFAASLFKIDVFQSFPVALVYIGTNAIFICYDIALSRLTNELLRRFGKYI